MYEKIKTLLKSLREKKDSKLLDLLTNIYVNYNSNKKITFDHYNRQHQAISTVLTKELNRILSFHNDIEFELYISRFRREFSKLCNTKLAVGTNSGTSALQLSLIALGVGQGDEVITVPNTYIATALAISNTGAKPVFVDIDKATFNIDASKMEGAINDETKAIVPVHLYGRMADMTPILKLAKQYNLKVVEDACQAFGAEYFNKKAGSLGDAGCFSFFSNKIFSGLGNGGMIVSSDNSFIEKVTQLKNLELQTDKLGLSKRTPCDLDAIQVAFLKAKLPYINEWLMLRREKAKLYNKLLYNSNLILPREEEGIRHSYYSYVIKAKSRDRLKAFLNKKGVETRIMYPTLLHLTKTFESLGYKQGSFPIAEKINKEILSLPISPFLKSEEIKTITRIIKNFS